MSEKPKVARGASLPSSASRRRWAGLIALALGLSGAAAQAAPCGSDATGFPAWLGAFKEEASGDGIPARILDQSLGDVVYDRAIISRDRSQGVFKLSFEKFSARLVTPSRLARGRALLQSNAGLLREIDARYGVPGPVLVSIWGLETGYGADNGRFRTLQALATLAYDCRRAQTFTDELKDALKIVAKGDMTPAQMRGDWAGEIGQTQFMPSSYLAYAVDFDGDGRRDLIRSKADALASTANFLKGKGWRAGAGWAEGEANFPIFLEWNKSNVYARTLAYFATRLNEGR